MKYTERGSEPAPVEQGLAYQFGIQTRTCEWYRMLVMDETYHDYEEEQ